MTAAFAFLQHRKFAAAYFSPIKSLFVWLRPRQQLEAIDFPHRENRLDSHPPHSTKKTIDWSAAIGLKWSQKRAALRIISAAAAAVVLFYWFLSSLRLRHQRDQDHFHLRQKKAKTGLLEFRSIASVSSWARHWNRNRNRNPTRSEKLRKLFGCWLEKKVVARNFRFCKFCCWKNETFRFEREKWFLVFTNDRWPEAKVMKLF